MTAAELESCEKAFKEMNSTPQSRKQAAMPARLVQQLNAEAYFIRTANYLQKTATVTA